VSIEKDQNQENNMLNSPKTQTRLMLKSYRELTWLKKRLMTFKVKFNKNCPKFKKYLKAKIENLITMKKMMMMEVIWKRPLIQLMDKNGIIMNFNEFF
jgi:hypothetical protein